MKEKGLLLAVYSSNPQVVTKFIDRLFPTFQFQFRPAQRLVFCPDGLKDSGLLNCQSSNPSQRVGVTPMEYSGLLNSTLVRGINVVMENGPAQAILEETSRGVEQGTAQRNHRMTISPNLTVVLEAGGRTMDFIQGHNSMRLDPDGRQSITDILRRLGSIKQEIQVAVRPPSRHPLFK